MQKKFTNYSSFNAEPRKKTKKKTHYTSLVSFILTEGKKEKKL